MLQARSFPIQIILTLSGTPSPRDKQFPSLVFQMRTLTEITAEDFRALVGPEPVPQQLTEPEKGVQDPTEFFLEKYLQEFITMVSP